MLVGLLGFVESLDQAAGTDDTERGRENRVREKVVEVTDPRHKTPALSDEWTPLWPAAHSHVTFRPW